MLPRPTIKIGDIGLKYFNTGCGRSHWTRFSVTNVKGNTITVQYDQPCNTKYGIFDMSQKDELDETFSWRSPGKWVPVGCTSKDFTYYRLDFSDPNKESGSEKGIF